MFDFNKLTGMNLTKPDIKIIIKLNGNSTIECNFVLRQHNLNNLDAIKEHVASRFKFKPNDIPKLRFFNDEGLEIFEEDLRFLKTKEVLYVSKGEEFNFSTFYSEYKISKILGQGGFGKVYLGIHKKTKKKVAIKITSSNGIDNSDDIDSIFTEFETVKALNHPNIVKILNYFVIKKSMQTYCIMEYLEGGELLQFLEENTKLDESQAREIFKQIISAIDYCHKHKIIHRDLKLENILRVDNDSLKIKIVDFGIAGLFAGHKSEITKAGSVNYLSPEIISRKNLNASPALDVWAIGCILYSILIGSLPFADKNEKVLMKKIVSQEVEFPKNVKISGEVTDLIKKMLNKNPEKRIRIIDIKQHPWFLDKKMKINIKDDKSLINNKLLEIKEENEVPFSSLKVLDGLKKKNKSHVFGSKKAILKPKNINK